MNKEYIDVISYEGEGYKPLIDYETWRIAFLRYIDELELENLKTMQKHDKTDEVFVLLAGTCTLFVGGNGDEVGEIDGIVMKQHQLYNVKKGVWHTHTVGKDSTVLIVENQNTSDVNSPTKVLNDAQRGKLMELGCLLQSIL